MKKRKHENNLRCDCLNVECVFGKLFTKVVSIFGRVQLRAPGRLPCCEAPRHGAGGVRSL